MASTSMLRMLGLHDSKIEQVPLTDQLLIEASVLCI